MLSPYSAYHPILPSLQNGLGRAVQTKRPIHIPDITAEQAYREREPLRVAAKGSVNAETALRKAISELITVRDGDKTKKMTRLEVAYTQLAIKAASGDLRALKLITQLLESFGGDAAFAGPSLL